MNFPALNGETVTEAHAKICANRGHATHTVDGVEQMHCPRCGEAKAEKFAEYQIVPKFIARQRALAYEIHKMDPATGHRVDVLDAYATEQAAQVDVTRLLSL